MQVPEFLEGNSPTRLFQGLVAGVILTLVLGFNYFGLSTTGTVKELVSEARTGGATVALTPYCTRAFETAVADDKSQKVKFMKADSWMRDTYMKKGGWATPLGADEPNDALASACASTMVAKYEAAGKKAEAK